MKERTLVKNGQPSSKFTKRKAKVFGAKGKRNIKIGRAPTHGIK